MDILGIDIGGSGVKGALVDITTGRLTTERHRIPTPSPAAPKAVARVVARLTRHFGWQGPIGCTLPGRVRHGVMTTAANVDKAWIGTDAQALFRKTTGCPTLVLNDADAAGVAEMAFGAGRGHTDYVILLTVGTGIGSAIFINQTLVPNSELGHLELDGHEAEKRAADSARKRDKLTWEKWARRLQRYLDHIESIFSPDLIILGGGVSRPRKFGKFSGLLHTRATLVPARLENEAGIIGAAYSARGLTTP